MKHPNYPAKRPENRDDAVAAFTKALDYESSLLPLILSSPHVLEEYVKQIGDADRVLDSPSIGDGGKNALARGSVLFFLLHRIALVPEAERDFNALKRISRDEDFRQFLTVFHRIPDTLGLEILEFHALGTTSFIFKARTNEHRICALKVIQAPYVRSLSITEATRDYQVLSQDLDPRYSPETFCSRPTWILMEFLEGRNLSEFMTYLRNRKAFGSDDYIAAVTQLFALITDALSFYETKRPPVVHGDLTPYNIIVQANDLSVTAIKIVDFGPNFVLQESLADRRVFAEVFARTELFVAPEIIGGTGRPSIRSDVYSLGMIGLELLSRMPLTKKSLGARLEAVWCEPLSSGLAQVIEDVIDESPDNRLLVTECKPELGVYRSINLFVQKQADLTKDHAEHWRLASALKRGLFPDIVTPIQNIGRIHRVWKEGSTKTQLHLSQINAFLFSVIVFFFVLYMFADFKQQFFPHADWLIDKKLLELVTAFPRDFVIGDIRGNLGGRLVALTFGIVAAHYYANIFSTLQITAVSRRLHVMANVVMALNAFSYFIPVMIAIVWNPLWWPWCSAAGIVFTVMNNTLSWRAAREAANGAQGVLSTAYAADSQEFVEHYSEWAVQMGLYCVMILAIGILLRIGAAKDELVYALIVSGINIGKIFRENCKSLAPSTRGNLSRLSFTARRLRALEAVKLRRSLATARRG